MNQRPGIWKCKIFTVWDVTQFVLVASDVSGHLLVPSASVKQSKEAMEDGKHVVPKRR